MKIKMGRRQNAKNILLNLLAFIIQFVISFYISPVIVSKVGASAYGFIGLATDFVSYASILAAVFNSVASRFIADSFYKQDYDSANKYFNSLIIANLILASFLGCISIVLISKLEYILNIPNALVFDVKLTFLLIFISYFITLITMVFTTSTFVTNRTDIQGIRNIIQYLIRFAIVFIFLNFVSVKIYWVALSTLIATAFIAIFNINLTHRLTPELRIDLKKSSKKFALELARSGSWMAITSISTVLLRGLDLTIANIYIGDYEMGLLSIGRTLPNNVTSVITTIAPLFTPVFIALYSTGKKNETIKEVQNSIRVMSLLFFVPISGFIIYSKDFYSLWQKTLNQNELLVVTIVSVLTVIQSYFDASTSTMAQISVVVNKLKMPVLVNLGCGIFSVIVEILLIKFTNLGVYAIVISTSILMIARYVFFNSIYAAWCLECKKNDLFMVALRNWGIVPVILLIMYFVRCVLTVNSWPSLGVSIIVSGVIGYAVFGLILWRKEIKMLLLRIRGRKYE